MGLIMALPVVMSSCGDDDDEAPASETANSTFTINGTPGGKILYSLCEDTPGGNVAIEVHFDFDNERYDLNLSISNLTIADLYAGLDITGHLKLYRFYPSTTMFWGDIRYEIIGGTAHVTSVRDSEVVVSYNNLKFTREIGEYGTPETFVLNGTISYTID